MIAVRHDQGDLILLIDRGNQIEYLQIASAEAAYEGLQQVSDYANSHCLCRKKDLPQFPLRPSPIPLFVNESGIFNRDENLSDSQLSLTTDSTQAIGDEPSQTREMLGNVNFS